MEISYHPGILMEPTKKTMIHTGGGKSSRFMGSQIDQNKWQPKLTGGIREMVPRMKSTV